MDRTRIDKPNDSDEKRYEKYKKAYDYLMSL